MRAIQLLIILLSVIVIIENAKASLIFNSQQLDEYSQKIDITFQVPKGDFIYKDYLDIAVDSPLIQISDLHYSHDALSFYDATFKETKKIFTKPFTITFKVTRKKQLFEQVCLHAT